MLDLTIIIPTNRPHEKYVRNVINNINSIPSRHSYQIAVCSQEKIDGDNVKWYKEHGQQGPIAAFNRIADECESEYVCCLVDDHIFNSNFSSGLEFLEEHYDKARFPIASLYCGPVDYNPVRGQVLGGSPVDFDVAAYPLCKFPIFHKRALKELGGKIFHPDLFYHAGDILLGYYMGMNGEPCRNAPVGIQPKNPKKDPSHEVKDCETVKQIIKKYVEGERNYLA
jgi:hypothetical protein